MGIEVDIHSGEVTEKAEILLLSHSFRIQKFGNTIIALK